MYPKRRTLYRRAFPSNGQVRRGRQKMSPRSFDSYERLAPMSTFVIPQMMPDVQEPPDDFVADLKQVIREEAETRKAKVSRFKTDKNRLEFSITPDDAGDATVHELNADTGITIVKVKSRFESFATKYNLGGKKSGK